MEVYWLGGPAVGVPLDDEWLGEGELAVLARLRFPKRRADWRLGRWTAKRAIARHLHLPCDAATLARIEVRPAPSGAPEAYVDGRAAELTLSLSHSGGVAFCALGPPGASLGCDVEQVASRSRTFAADYFTAEEQELAAGSDETDLVLTLLWSAKESALKALQCGLRSDTRSVAVVPDGLPPLPGEAWHPLTASNAGGRMFHGWWRKTGTLVWTLVSSPSPLTPLAISLLTAQE